MNKFLVVTFFSFFNISMYGQPVVEVEGEIDVKEERIINLADPIDEQDAVSKRYVDEQLMLLHNTILAGGYLKSDGQIYHIVEIGTQTWMAENLNIGVRLDGMYDQKDNGEIEKYCYDDLESNCDKYGGLYQWGEIMHYSTIPGIQGICPTGWHIPTHAEFITLANFLGGTSVAGGKLKQAGFVNWIMPNTGATNESGFLGLPTGSRQLSDGAFANAGLSAFFWSSTELDSTFVRSRNLGTSGTSFSSPGYNKGLGISVRCIKD